jgi:hypothetical protein
MTMASLTKQGDGKSTLHELKEFSSFSPASQRYIRRSLDVAFGRRDPILYWARDGLETASIKAQRRVYQSLDIVRQTMPVDGGYEALHPFMGPLIAVAGFDLGQDRLEGFSEFRFLYERLLGASVRPWLPTAFCGAAALPTLHPLRRRFLLQSISEAAATAPGWSAIEPSFFPEWVEKEEA